MSSYVGNDDHELANDGLLPSQFYGERGVRTPEQRMLLACLEDAIALALRSKKLPYGDGETKERRSVAAQREAAEWIATPGGSKQAWTFDDICDYLGLDHEYLRAGLARSRGNINFRRRHNPVGGNESLRQIGSQYRTYK